MDHKPRLFVISSVESLDIARAVHENLEYDAEVTVWDQGAWELSKSTSESLINIVNTMDFCIAVFSPDDVMRWKRDDEEHRIVRDNVIFELGLFMGRLGRERCYIIQPRGIDFHLPSDLIGITPATYDPHRSDGVIKSALTPGCNRIREAIKKNGRVKMEEAIGASSTDLSSIVMPSVAIPSNVVAAKVNVMTFDAAMQCVDRIQAIFRTYVEYQHPGVILTRTQEEREEMKNNQDNYEAGYNVARSDLIRIDGIGRLLPAIIMASVNLPALLRNVRRNSNVNGEEAYLADELERFVQRLVSLM